MRAAAALRAAALLCAAALALAAVAARAGADDDVLRGDVTVSQTLQAAEGNFYAYEVTNRTVAVQLTLSVSGADADADLFVSRSFTERPQRSNAEHSTAAQPKHKPKTLVLNLDAKANGLLHVGVYGTAGSPKYELKIKRLDLADPVKGKLGSAVTAEGSLARFYELPISAGDVLNVSMRCSAETSSKLFVSFDERHPSFHGYRVFRHVPAGTEHAFVLTAPAAASALYAAVRNSEEAGSCDLTVSALTGVTPVELVAGKPQSVSLQAGQYKYFAFAMGEDVVGTLLRVTTKDDGAAVFLVVSAEEGDYPTAQSHTMRAEPSEDGKESVHFLWVQPSAPSKQYVIGVYSTSACSASVSAEAVLASDVTKVVPGKTYDAPASDTRPVHYEFVVASEHVGKDLNISVHASAGGVEVFTDSKPWPCFSHYTSYDYVIANRVLSSLVQLKQAGSVHLVLRPTRPGAHTTFVARIEEHQMERLGSKSVSLALGKGEYKFFDYIASSAAFAVEFVLDVHEGNAELFVGDEGNARPVDGHAQHTSMGHETMRKNHKNVVMQLHPSYETQHYHVGVGALEDGTKASVSAVTQERTAPQAIAADDREHINSNAHTLYGFYVVENSSPDVDLNVTVSTDSASGAHFFADRRVTHPSFFGYEWFRHVTPHEPVSVLLCVHESTRLYISTRSLAHAGSVTLRVKPAPHKVSFATLPQGYA